MGALSAPAEVLDEIHAADAAAAPPAAAYVSISF